MPHNQNHLHAERKSDGKIVFIDDVPLGIKCGCICSKCGICNGSYNLNYSM